MNDMFLGVQLMFYGIIGVFSVLMLFYLLIVLLNKFFPYKEESEK